MTKELTNLSYIKELSRKYGFTFEKKFGQNFIVNPSVCPKICEFAEVDENTGVLEIGVGVGVLTSELMNEAWPQINSGKKQSARRNMMTGDIIMSKYNLYQ